MNVNRNRESKGNAQIEDIQQAGFDVIGRNGVVECHEGTLDRQRDARAK